MAAVFFLEFRRLYRYLIPDVLDVRFRCEVIIKNDTKEFCFWNFFDLLAIEF